MKYIVVFRSPQTKLRNGDELSESAKALFLRYAGYLQRLCRGIQSADIITSPAPQNITAGNILRRAVGMRLFASDDIWQELYNERPCQEIDMIPFMNVVQSRWKSEVLVIMTHYPFPDTFPVFLASQAWNKKVSAICVPKSAGVIISVREKCAELFAPFEWIRKGNVAVLRQS